MQSPVTCPFLAFRDCRLPSRTPSCRPANTSRHLATFLDTALPCKAPSHVLSYHFETAVCQAGHRPAGPQTLLGIFGHISGHSLALQSPVTCPFLPFRDCRLPSRTPSCRPRKRFSAALAIFLDTALPCKAPSHVLSYHFVTAVCQAGPPSAGQQTLLGSLGHISGHSLALQSPVTCPFLAFRECRLPGWKPSCRPGNVSRQLWPHCWTQPCLAKPRHMSFLTVSRLPFPKPETIAGLQTPLGSFVLS